MKVFLSLCLLFCLVSPAALVVCNICQSEGEIECARRGTKKCQPSDSCYRTVVGGDLLNGLVTRKRYGCSRCEPENYAFTTGENRSFSFTTECCRSDRCNTILPQVPMEPMEPNGLECLGCYAENKEECRGVEGVRCPGDQTKCMKIMLGFLYRRSYENKIISARGCATPSMCDKLKVHDTLLSEHYYLYDVSVKCTDAL